MQLLAGSARIIIAFDYLHNLDLLVGNIGWVFSQLVLTSRGRDVSHYV